MAKHKDESGTSLHNSKVNLLASSPVSLSTVATVAGELSFDNTTSTAPVLYSAKSTTAGDWVKVVASAGSVAHSVLSKTANYTAVSGDADGLIKCSASGGAFTITLPAAASNSGMQLSIKKTDSSANFVTVDGNASETIDGATTFILMTQYESITIVCDGSNWFII